LTVRHDNLCAFYDIRFSNNDINQVEFMTVNIQASAFIFRTLVLAIILGLIAYFVSPLLQAEASMIAAREMAAYVAIASLLTSLLHFLVFRLGQRTTTLYVGNLAFKTSENELYDLFSQYGAISSVRIMKDRITRRPRGYAFVELSAAGAKSAIRDLNGNEFGGRTLKVNVANKRGRRQD
jgi:hypothetical protein